MNSNNKKSMLRYNEEEEVPQEHKDAIVPIWLDSGHKNKTKLMYGNRELDMN